MGGAMDLVANPDNTKIVVATDHCAKDGSSKIKQQCTLPLTGARVVSTIITDLVSLLSLAGDNANNVVCIRGRQRAGNTDADGTCAGCDCRRG